MAIPCYKESTFSCRNCITLITLCVTLFAGSYAGTYVLPSLPEMILWFGYSEEQKASYAGALSSLYFFGMGVTGYFWIQLSNKIGRKLTLIISLILNGVLCLLFGFSVHFAMAIALRFLNGAVDCVYVIINNSVADHFAVHYQPVAQIVLHIALSLGNSFGPAISGFVSFPGAKYSRVFGQYGFFDKFPFIVPSVIGFGLNLVAVIFVCGFYAEEEPNDYDLISGDLTDTTKTNVGEYKPDREIETANPFAFLDDNRSLDIFQQSKPDNKEDKPIANRHMVKYGIDNDQFTEANGDETTCYSGFLKSDLGKLLQNKESLVLITAFGILIYSATGQAEIFVIWASTTNDLGGLEQSSSSIGLILALSIIPAYIVTFFTLVPMQRQFGETRTFTIYGTLFFIVTSALPTTRFINEPKLRWGIVLLGKIVLQSSTNACFTLLSFLLNSSLPLEHYGAINKISLLMSSVPMAIAPNIGGAIYAASITSPYDSPIDNALVFVLYGLTAWICCIMVYIRPQQFTNFEAK